MEITRRKLITNVAGGLVGLTAAPVLASTPSTVALPKDGVRSLSLFNSHTGESVKAVTYFEDGAYVHNALTELNYLLRDHRADETVAMDPKLMDLLFALQKQLGTDEEIKVISAYRSPKTNAMLAKRSGKVAKRSYHMKGMAIDISMKGRKLRDIQKVARVLKLGGVGRYSSFVHVDTGPVRAW